MKRAAIFLGLIAIASAHSWVACTDYRDSSFSGTYDFSKCKGFPRNWQSVATNVFGDDRGFNYQGNEGQACRDPFSGGNSYTSAYPKAQYAVGSTVCLAWPAKNHKADTCTNNFIPDTQTSLFASGPNPTADPTQSAFKNNVIAAELGGKHTNGQIDNKGFQNCPSFCPGTDKALCGQCFTVPQLQVGATYTFQWYWIFNEGSPPYTTCWEADIVASGGGGGVNPTPTSGSGSPAPATTAPVLNGNSIFISSAPLTVSTTTSGFTVKVQYSATSNRVITVDMLDTGSSSPKWYGKGTARIGAGAGTADVAVTFQGSNKIALGGKYMFRAWLVEASKFSDQEKDQSWLYEDDVQDQDFTVGSAVVYPTNIAGNSDATSIRAQAACFALVAAFFAFFV